MPRRILTSLSRIRRLPRRRGVVTAEYIILLTLVGIGVIVGLAAVREALLTELCDLAAAIAAINP